MKSKYAVYVSTAASTEKVFAICAAYEKPSQVAQSAKVIAECFVFCLGDDERPQLLGQTASIDDTVLLADVVGDDPQDKILAGLDLALDLATGALREQDGWEAGTFDWEPAPPLRYLVGVKLMGEYEKEFEAACRSSGCAELRDALSKLVNLPRATMAL